MKVLCILTNNFEEIEAIGTYAILSRGKVLVDLVSLHDEELTGKYGLHITKLKKLNEINYKDYDCLFIAGGSQYIELEHSETFKNIVKYFFNNDKYIAAICAGPTILGHMGLLKNKNYTCFNSMNDNFGGNYIDKYAVRDGKLITGKSAAATIEFAFLLLENLMGKEVSEHTKESVFYYHN